MYVPFCSSICVKLPGTGIGVCASRDALPSGMDRNPTRIFHGNDESAPWALSSSYFFGLAAASHAHCT